MKPVRHAGCDLLVSAVLLVGLGSVPLGADDRADEAASNARPHMTSASLARPPVSRLGAINVPYEEYRRFVELGYDFIARVRSGEGPDATPEAVHAVLEQHGIEHFDIGPAGNLRISKMGLDHVPPERRGLKRGPGHNKYTNLDTVCAGWDEPYRFLGREVAEKLAGKPESGAILEDHLNRALCYCPACEEDYRRETGRPGFPTLVYPTPHYEDTVAFDPDLIAWDRARTARHFRLLAEPIHAIGKKIAVAGTCRWIVGPDAASAVDHVMFYTYYAGRRLPPNFMRNWKYWHDHIISDKLWLIFGYFREFHTCHTRLMLANLPDGVNLAFWACYRQAEDPECREDALYARDVAASSLAPIRIAVYDSQATRRFLGPQADSWRERHVERATIGLQRLGLDATPVSSLEHFDAFEMVYMEDVECLSQREIDRIVDAKIPILASGLTGLRDEEGQLWGELRPNLPRAHPSDKVLNLPSPVTLDEVHLNVETERLLLEAPWFDFIFETVSPRRGDSSLERPYTDPSLYQGVAKHRLSLIPSRVYGEFLDDAVVSRHEGYAVASSSETRRPMIVHDADRHQAYSTIRFSDYVNEHDLTECGYGYEMRQFCFLQIIDALTLERRGVRVEPYLMTAVRRTETGLFLTIGNVYDEPRKVTLTLDRPARAVRVNHEPYDVWDNTNVHLPAIAAKGAIQVHVDFP